jgi:hypothetical protein
MFFPLGEYDIDPFSQQTLAQKAKATVKINT